jgi:hypothetical protein
MGNSRQPCQDRSDAERALLQALCQGVESESLWPEALAALSGFRFADPLHQVVFDVLRGIHSTGSHIIKERVQRALVLAGFPALDAGAYFQPHGLSRAEARSLLSSLTT